MSNLEKAMISLDGELINYLNEKGFITDKVRDDIRNPRSSTLSEADKVWELVKSIENRVEQDPSSFHELLDYFKEAGAHYRPVVKILEEEFEQQCSGSGEQEGLSVASGTTPSIAQSERKGELYFSL